MFAFQALEGYANWIIAWDTAARFKLERKGKTVDFTPAEVERQCSTEEKLATILPSILKLKSFKGSRLWERFQKAKTLRDDVVHLKSPDMFAWGSSPKPLPLYKTFFDSDPLASFSTARDIILHFSQTQNGAHQLPDWILRCPSA